MASDSRHQVDRLALGQGHDGLLVIGTPTGTAAEPLGLALDPDGVDRPDLDFEQPLDSELDLRLGGVQRHLEGDLAEFRAAGRLLGDRSEEPTSELQSLMRISYAVFCFKQKTTHNNYTHLR